MPDVKVAILISTYNRPEMLTKTLNSLIDSFHTQDADIFVIDDGSDGETAKAIFPYIKHIHYYKRLSKNHGLRYVLNDGLDMIALSGQYDYVSYNQDDVIFSHGWLDECIKIWEKSPIPVGFVSGHDAPEHPTEGKIRIGNLHCKVKPTLRATHLFASRKRWDKFGYIPDLTPGVAAPKPGIGSLVDWWLVGHPEGKYPESDYSVKKMGEKCIVIPGRVIHIGNRLSTWSLGTEEYEDRDTDNQQ